MLDHKVPIAAGGLETAAPTSPTSLAPAGEAQKKFAPESARLLASSSGKLATAAASMADINAKSDQARAKQGAVACPPLDAAASAYGPPPAAPGDLFEAEPRGGAGPSPSLQGGTKAGTAKLPIAGAAKSSVGDAAQLPTAGALQAPLPRGPNPLPASEHAQISEAFAAVMPSLFGSDLSYGFICGSVARGHAIRADDIDTFIVLKQDNPLARERYTTWLSGLHMRHAMQVDHDYPHEIVTRSQLDDDVFPRLDATRLSLHFNSSSTFDVVTWAEMISSHHVAFVGSREAFEADRARCSPYVQRWLGQLQAALRDGGDMADKARRYRQAQAEKSPGEADLAPNFAWDDLSIYSLPRLMRRVVPLADTPPPAGTSDVVEACMNLPVLHTPRLTLRPLGAADGPALFDLCSRPEVACFTSWEAWKKPSQADAFIAYQVKQAAAGKWSPWAVCLADTETLIGTMTFTDFDEDARSAEIGFIMHPDKQRLGFTHEAAARVIAFGREELGLHRLAANCEEENVPCQSLLLKLGLRFEARLPDRAFKRDRFRNLVTFATLFPEPDNMLRPRGGQG